MYLGDSENDNRALEKQTSQSEYVLIKDYIQC